MLNNGAYQMEWIMNSEGNKADVGVVSEKAASLRREGQRRKKEPYQ